MANPVTTSAVVILLMAFLMLPRTMWSLSELHPVHSQNAHSAKDGYYTAAVYEHAPYVKSPQDVTLDTIGKNLMAYEQAISAAARQGADIIVFPEGGLIPLTSREIYKEYGEYVPDSDVQTWNPCELAMSPLIAKTLSCMAKRHNMYVVANMMSKEPCSFDEPDCPDDEVYIYNTNVVFNRKGELVARYNKYHLFFEWGMNFPKSYQYVIFETDFAKIGTFICFDIMWKPSIELLKKHKVDTVVFPLYWIETPPIYSSIQVTSSWAMENGVNLLAANVQQPSNGGIGSGIFLGASNIAHYVYKLNGKSKLIVAKVPVRGSAKPISSHDATVIEIEHPWTTFDNSNISGGCSEKILGPPTNAFDFQCIGLDLSNFTLARLQRGKGSARACNNGLCCLVKYDAVGMDEDYYLAVSNATLYLANYYGIWLETCMVIRCNEHNGTRCSRFPTQSNTIFRQLSMKADITSGHVYPSVITSGMQLLSPDMWSYANGTLSLKTSDGLLFAVMNGRPYDRDPPYPRR